MATPDPLRPPDSVRDVLATLWRNGHAAYVVGGGVRDELLGRPAKDWDVTTDALPERLVALFPGGRIDNAFGTVTVPLTAARAARRAIDRVEVTTFRRDHVYTDHRRPHSVTFTDDLGEDLPAARLHRQRNRLGQARPCARPGAGDRSDAGRIRPTVWPISTLGHCAPLAIQLERFEEDALRLLRGARLAAQLDFEIEPATLSGMTGAAETIKWVSKERVGEELRRMLDADRPSRAFELLATDGSARARTARACRAARRPTGQGAGHGPVGAFDGDS